jgi:hypothetical protein
MGPRTARGPSQGLPAASGGQAPDHGERGPAESAGARPLPAAPLPRCPPDADPGPLPSALLRSAPPRSPPARPRSRSTTRGAIAAALTPVAGTAQALPLHEAVGACSRRTSPRPSTCPPRDSAMEWLRLRRRGAAAEHTHAAAHGGHGLRRRTWPGASVQASACAS